MFVLPAEQRAIVGTTDTFTSQSPDEVRATESDVAYLLRAVNHHFPGARATRDDVVSAWAGIRPLAAQGATEAPSSASREHSIVEHVPGLVRVTGGKLTTYRAMAAEVADAVERSLGRTPTPSRTAALPLAGGDMRDVDAEIARAEQQKGIGRIA